MALKQFLHLCQNERSNPPFEELFHFDATHLALDDADFESPLKNSGIALSDAETADERLHAYTKDDLRAEMFFKDPERYQLLKTPLKSDSETDSDEEFCMARQFERLFIAENARAPADMSEKKPPKVPNNPGLGEHVQSSLEFSVKTESSSSIYVSEDSEARELPDLSHSEMDRTPEAVKKVHFSPGLSPIAFGSPLQEVHREKTPRRRVRRRTSLGEILEGEDPLCVDIVAGDAGTFREEGEGETEGERVEEGEDEGAASSPNQGKWTWPRRKKLTSMRPRRLSDPAFRADVLVRAAVSTTRSAYGLSPSSMLLTPPRRVSVSKYWRGRVQPGRSGVHNTSITGARYF